MGPKLAFAMAADKTRHVFDDAALARLARSCQIVREAPLEEFSSAEARQVLGEIEILITGWGCPMVSAEVLRGAPNLRLIAHAAGTVKFTLDPAVYAAGIRVTHAADANAVPVAEFTLAIAVQNLSWGLLQPFAGAADFVWQRKVRQVAGNSGEVCLLLLHVSNKAGQSFRIEFAVALDLPVQEAG